MIIANKDVSFLVFDLFVGHSRKEGVISDRCPVFCRVLKKQIGRRKDFT